MVYMDPIGALWSRTHWLLMRTLDTEFPAAVTEIKYPEKRGQMVSYEEHSVRLQALRPKKSSIPEKGKKGVRVIRAGPKCVSHWENERAQGMGQEWTKVLGNEIPRQCSSLCTMSQTNLCSRKRQMKKMWNKEVCSKPGHAVQLLLLLLFAS